MTMQIKTTIRYHCTLIIIDEIKNIDDTHIYWQYIHTYVHTYTVSLLLIAMQNSITSLENYFGSFL